MENVTKPSVDPGTHISTLLAVQILELIERSGATDVEAISALGAARELLVNLNLRQQTTETWWVPSEQAR